MISNTASAEIPRGCGWPKRLLTATTLLLMAEEGIKFTILSPYQAARWRFREGDTQWCDAAGGTIPNGRAYRYSLRRREIYPYLFLRLRPWRAEWLSTRCSNTAASCSIQIDRTWSLRGPFSGEPWLVNAATDGESYGHHFKFGDMALAAAFEELERDPSAEISQLRMVFVFFSRLSPKLKSSNERPGAAPMDLGGGATTAAAIVEADRAGLKNGEHPCAKRSNMSETALPVHFETQMESLCADPWAARDEYIDLVLDRKNRLAGFLEKHLGGRLALIRCYSVSWNYWRCSGFQC